MEIIAITQTEIYAFVEKTIFYPRKAQISKFKTDKK